MKFKLVITNDDFGYELGYIESNVQVNEDLNVLKSMGMLIGKFGLNKLNEA
ncbi:hypothetical protein KHA80_22505 [Anaerobacillus sp. HL2]|nr:hypothetical protein KHA80_22505 [Anaerobacillus sp. HL2]